MHIKKKTIPNVSDAGGDINKHLAFAQHAVSQIAAGHYGVKDEKQEDLGNGEVRLSFTRFETNPAEPAEPHGL